MIFVYIIYIDMRVPISGGASKSSISMFFHQQRKLMGSSAQNSSGVHWCRRRVRFNEVPEEGSEGSGEGSGRLWCRARSPSIGFRRRFWKRFRRRSGRLWLSQVKFNRVPEKVAEKVAVRFDRVPEKVPEKVWEAFVRARLGSGEGSGL